MALRCKALRYGLMAAAVLLWAGCVSGRVTEKPVRHTVVKRRRVAGSAKPLCPSSCRFRFCDAARDSVMMTVPMVAVTSPICLHNFARLQVARLGEAYVRTDQDGRIPVSKLHLRRPDFKPSVELPKFPFVVANATVSAAAAAEQEQQERQPASAFAASRLTWNQRTLLDRKCIHIPIVDYSLVPSSSSSGDDMRSEPDRTAPWNADLDCIAFQAVRPRFEVRLRWFTKDDLDLEVVEPNGDLLYYTQRRTQAGLFLLDDNNEDCLSNTGSGLEAIAYQPGSAFADGDYVIRIRRFTTCTGYSSPTRFRVIVLLDGRPWFKHEDIALDTTRDGTIYSSLIRLTFKGRNASYKIGNAARD